MEEKLCQALDYKLASRNSFAFWLHAGALRQFCLLSYPARSAFSPFFHTAGGPCQEQHGHFPPPAREAATNQTRPIDSGRSGRCGTKGGSAATYVSDGIIVYAEKQRRDPPLGKEENKRNTNNK